MKSLMTPLLTTALSYRNKSIIIINNTIILNLNTNIFFRSQDFNHWDFFSSKGYFTPKYLTGAEYFKIIQLINQKLTLHYKLLYK